MRPKYKEPTKREREETAAERELCRFVVWDVYGFVRGSLALLATFPFKQEADATAYANATHGGYVMRSRRRTQPATVNPATLTVHKEPEPQPATLADMKREILAEPPLSAERIAELTAAKYRVRGWTG